MLLRKLFRTAWKYKAQFISMIIMVAIGIGIFVGFNMEWYSLEKNTGDFFTQTDLYHYRVINEQGFTVDDVTAIRERLSDNGVYAHRVLQVNVDVPDKHNSVSIWCEENERVSALYNTSGSPYNEHLEGFWLSDKYAEANGYKVGDTFTVSYRGVSISAPIQGLGKSGEYAVCVADSNQLMPDLSTFGFAFVTPVTIENAFKSLPMMELFTVPYPMICFNADITKDQAEQKVSEALGKTTLLLSLDEHTSYAAAQGEIEEGQTMVSILPVLFLLIGVLTMITTMHRVTANEKTQIGTLKALGFKNGKIIRHYTAYGLFIGIVGAILGIALGIGICAFVINPNGMMGTYLDLPKWGLYAPWWTWLVLAGIVAFLTLISFLSVKKMLKGTAADALRPYVPKKVKPLAIEKTKVWNKMSFATKWNLRDVFRHKTRSIMTLVGIIGCMILLVGGLGMQDTMTGFLDTLDTQVMNYETRVNFAETVSNEQAIEFAEKYDGDYVASSSVQVNGEPITLEVYNVSHNLVKFIDKNNKEVTLTDEGAYISLRVADRGFKVGDTLEFSPYGSEESYSVKVAGILRSYTMESITMTVGYADSASIPYTISSAFVNQPASNIETVDYVSGTQTKTAIMDSYNGFMEVLNTMVWVLILAAVILGIVVLYNLGVMSYVERYRELATLKVVGFKNKHIGRILISQNIWLTIIGIIIGLPAGVGVLHLLLALLASEYELKMILGALTYCVSILLTFGVSLVVGLLVARKNRKINMVEALKGAE